MCVVSNKFLCVKLNAEQGTYSYTKIFETMYERLQLELLFLIIKIARPTALRISRFHRFPRLGIEEQ